MATATETTTRKEQATASAARATFLVPSAISRTVVSAAFATTTQKELDFMSLVSQAPLLRIAIALAHAEMEHATTEFTVSVSVALAILTSLGKTARRPARVSTATVTTT